MPRPRRAPEHHPEHHDGPDDTPFLSTHDLKGRGWTPALIRDFLGPHDASRPNRMRLGGRRRLPPVKLYLRERVDDAETSEDFLVAQNRAMEARERAERARETRARNKAAQIEAFVQSWHFQIAPQPLRRGAQRKAYRAHEDELVSAVARAIAQLGRLSKRELSALTARLREQYEAALQEAYPWWEAEVR